MRCRRSHTILIVTTDALFFPSFFFLFYVLVEICAVLLLSRNKRGRLETAEWSQSEFRHFLEIRPKIEDRALRNFSPRKTVRDREPPAADVVTASLFLRLTHCTEAGGRLLRRVPRCSVLSRQTAYNADSAYPRKTL